MAPESDLRTAEETLREIARQGNRKHLLWQLAADGRSFVGLHDTAREEGVEDASIEQKVATFIEAVDRHMNASAKEDVSWENVEKSHGDRADEILAAAEEEELAHE